MKQWRDESVDQVVSCYNVWGKQLDVPCDFCNTTAADFLWTRISNLTDNVYCSNICKICLSGKHETN
jgi:hypothetical protein